MKEFRLMDWGFSMYGGYYATLIKDFRPIGLHADKLKDLRKQLAEYGIDKLETWKRRDN